MTTTNLKLPPRRRWHDLPVPVSAGICVLALLAIAILVGRLRSMPSPAAEVKPVIIVATSQPLPPTATPAAVVAAVVPPRMVVAFAAPDGAVLGPIPAPDISAVLARYGDAWALVPWEAGQVWVRAADVGLPDVADLEPPPAPQVVYQPVYQPAYAAPTPTEQGYTITNEPPAEPTAAPVVRKEDFKEPDPKAACAFVGCLPGR